MSASTLIGQSKWTFTNGNVSVHNILVLEFKEQTEAWNHEDRFDQEFTMPE